LDNKNKERLKCWEFYRCRRKECPAFKSKDLRCWLVSETHCRDEIQGNFLEKMEMCLDCDVFKANINTREIGKTLALVNKQLKEYRQLVDDRDKELERLATTDRLTGAYNRTKFDEIIEGEIERVKRYNKALSVIMFDIDNFKKINDTYGHSAGDDVLKAIAEIVRKIIRKTDYFVRWGGEEFVIISPETNLKKAHILAERIRQTIDNYEFDIIGKTTASFGVAIFIEAETADNFLKRADDVMYAAKTKGKNRVEVGV